MLCWDFGLKLATSLRDLVVVNVLSHAEDAAKGPSAVKIADVCRALRSALNRYYQGSEVRVQSECVFVAPTLWSVTVRA